MAQLNPNYQPNQYEPQYQPNFPSQNQPQYSPSNNNNQSQYPPQNQNQSQYPPQNQNQYQSQYPPPNQYETDSRRSFGNNSGKQAQFSEQPSSSSATVADPFAEERARRVSNRFKSILIPESKPPCRKCCAACILLLLVVPIRIAGLILISWMWAYSSITNTNPPLLTGILASLNVVEKYPIKEEDQLELVGEFVDYVFIPWPLPSPFFYYSVIGAFFIEALTCIICGIFCLVSKRIKKLKTIIMVWIIIEAAAMLIYCYGLSQFVFEDEYETIYWVDVVFTIVIIILLVISWNMLSSLSKQGYHAFGQQPTLIGSDIDMQALDKAFRRAETEGAMDYSQMSGQMSGQISSQNPSYMNLRFPDSSTPYTSQELILHPAGFGKDSRLIVQFDLSNLAQLLQGLQGPVRPTPQKEAKAIEPAPADKKGDTQYIPVPVGGAPADPGRVEYHYNKEVVHDMQTKEAGGGGQTTVVVNDKRKKKKKKKDKKKKKKKGKKKKKKKGKKSKK